MVQASSVFYCIKRDKINSSIKDCNTNNNHSQVSPEWGCAQSAESTESGLSAASVRSCRASDNFLPHPVDYRVHGTDLSNPAHTRHSHVALTVHQCQQTATIFSQYFADNSCLIAAYIYAMLLITKLVHWPLTDTLLHLIQQEEVFVCMDQSFPVNILWIPCSILLNSAAHHSKSPLTPW